MALPVDANWKNFLVREVHPLLESADNTGAINQWYFECVYRRGPLFDVYLETDSSAVHTILRPLLQERFGHLASRRVHPNSLLESISPKFEIMPADIDEDCLTDLHVTSTQIVASHGISTTGLTDCLTEISAALHGIKCGPEWISAFAKTQLGNWLDQYFHNRCTVDQIADRQQHEAELMQFLAQQPAIPKQALLHPKKAAWIEGFQDLFMLFDGETYIANALNQHIARYGLSPFQVAQMWLANIDEHNADNIGASSTAARAVSSL